MRREKDWRRHGLTTHDDNHNMLITNTVRVSKLWPLRLREVSKLLACVTVIFDWWWPVRWEEEEASRE